MVKEVRSIGGGDSDFVHFSVSVRSRFSVSSGSFRGFSGGGGSSESLSGISGGFVSHDDAFVFGESLLDIEGVEFGFGNELGQEGIVDTVIVGGGPHSFDFLESRGAAGARAAGANH